MTGYYPSKTCRIRSNMRKKDERFHGYEGLGVGLLGLPCCALVFPGSCFTRDELGTDEILQAVRFLCAWIRLCGWLTYLTGTGLDFFYMVERS